MNDSLENVSNEACQIETRARKCTVWHCNVSQDHCWLTHYQIFPTNKKIKWLWQRPTYIKCVSFRYQQPRLSFTFTYINLAACMVFIKTPVSSKIETAHLHLRGHEKQVFSCLSENRDNRTNSQFSWCMSSIERVVKLIKVSNKTNRGKLRCTASVL